MPFNYHHDIKGAKVLKTCLSDGQSVLFIGDSITDCDRNINNWGALGFGYVSIFNELLIMNEPEKTIMVINKGIGGNTLGHLLSRWGDDVYEYQPDVLFVLAGINDATRFLDNSPSYYLKPAEYKDVLKGLVSHTLDTLPKTRIILMEPFYLTKGNNPDGSYRNDLKKIVQKYIDAVAGVSRIFNIDHVRLNAIFQRIVEHKGSSVISEDKIHLNRLGHMVIAHEIYKVLSK